MKKSLLVFLAAVLCLILCACGSSPNGKKEDAPSTAQKAEDMIEFDNILVAESKDVKIELVNFYAEDAHWSAGTQNEKYVTFRFSNKSGSKILLNADDFYLDNERALIMVLSGSISLESGRSGKYTYLVAEDTTPEHTALKSLDELYDLEGSFSGGKYDENGNFDNSIDMEFSIRKAVNGEVAAVAAPDMEKYGDVVQKLTDGTWYFNGGSDTVLNSIIFSDNTATISQVYYDGNGKHDGETNEFSYMLDDTSITVTLADNSQMTIPYTYADGSVVLSPDTYFTEKDIMDGLQGFWTLDSRGVMSTRNIYYIHFDGEVVSSEKAASALNGGPGDYYWYGGNGYTGTYHLNFGGIDSEMMHSKEWFFNIVHGEVVLLHYDSVCSRADITKLPGQYGYSFK